MAESSVYRESTKSKYAANHGFFDVIDSEASAYFLGLLMADGWNNEDRHQVGLSLKESDRALVESFQLAAGFTGPVLSINKQYAGMKSPQNAARCVITSRRMSGALASHGCVQRKSLTLKFPAISPPLLRHFFRGYFDGDGCIHLVKNRGACSISFVGSKDFVLKSCEVLGHLGIRVVASPHKTLWQGSVSTTAGQIAFCKLLYDDAAHYLRRKRDLAVAAVERIESRRRPKRTADEKHAMQLARDRNWRVKNPDRAKEKDRKFREKYREKRIAYMREYHKRTRQLKAMLYSSSPAAADLLA